MPFTTTKIVDEIEQRRQNNPAFKKAWDESRIEYDLIGEMIKLRKEQALTQTALAKLIGRKQQVISKIELKETSPTIGAFNTP